MKKENSNQNEKVEKMVVLVKTCDHYHRMFQLFQGIWNWNLDTNLIMTLQIMAISTVLLEKLYTILR